MTAGEFWTGLGRLTFKIIAVLFIGIVLGVYTVGAIGAAILGASLSKH